MPETACYDWLLSVSNGFVSVGADFMVQSTFVVGLGLGAASLLGKKSALLQNLLLKGILVAVLLCPFLSVIMRTAGFEGVTVRVPEAVMPGNDAADLSALSIVRGEGGEHARFVLPDDESGLFFPPVAYDSLRPLAVRLQDRFSRIDFSVIHQRVLRHCLPVVYVLFMLSWLVMAFVMVVKLAFFIVRIYHFRRTGEIPSRNVLILNRNVARSLMISPPLVLESEYVTSPFLCGILRPVILIPVGFDVTREILIHEHAHLIRRDCVWKLLLEIACAVYPLQPLMRLLVRAIDFTDDYVCDDYVVRLGRNPRAYAEQLYTVASQYRMAEFDTGISACFVSMRGSLKRRIERILVHSGRLVVKPGILMVIGVCAVSMMCAMVAGTVDFIGGAHEDVAAVVSRSMPDNETGDRLADVDDVKIADTMSAKVLPVEVRRFPAQAVEVPSIKKQPELPLASFLEIPDMEFAFDELDVEIHGEVQESLESFDVLKDYYKSNTQPEVPVEDLYPSEMQYDPDRPAVLDINPEALDDMDACKKAGRELLSLGSWGKAERVLCRAMEFDSQDHEVRYLLGLVYNGKRESDMAILYFKLAIALKSDYAQAYYDLGKTYQARGEADRAWDYYKVAIDLNPAYSRENSKYIIN